MRKRVSTRFACDSEPRDVFCESLAWDYSKLGSFVKCPARRRVDPCLCGCALDEHSFASGFGWEHCESCSCGLYRRASNLVPVETSGHVQWTCSDICTCGERMCGEDFDPRAVYLVTAKRDDAWVPLLGPYAWHSTALSMVDTAKRMAEKFNYAEAWRWSYGTARWVGEGCPDGRLNGDLPLIEEEKSLG